jgi:hypothetical protein
MFLAMARLARQKEAIVMKRIGFMTAVLIGFGGLALAQMSSELQQKAAAAKEAAAKNQQALHAYSWISTTKISLKGEVKNTKIESCQYGPDGKVQKTELSEPPAPQEQEGGRRRGGRLKEAMIEKKTGEMKEELESAAALVQSYVPPSPDKLQAVIAAGKVTMVPGAATSAIQFADYEKAGDSLTLTLDSAAKSLQKINVDTWLDQASNKVTLAVNFQSLPDGTNYAATTVMEIPAKQIEVQIENSNYEKVAP